MSLRLYSDLTPWYRMLTPASEYEEEAAYYVRCLREARPDVRTVLELGCGAGHNAAWMKPELDLTLTDLSPEMLALSRQINPALRHELGDMRTLRLDDRFDAVFVHDAIDYMTTRADLRAVMETAKAHLEPGGVVLLVPDDVKDWYSEGTNLYTREEGDRTFRCVEHSWDPDPDDDVCVVDFRFELIEGGATTVVEERHTFGLFHANVWWALLEEVGFAPSLRRDGPDGAPVFTGVLRAAER